MEQRINKIPAKADRSVFLRVMPGHFATSHSHINHYIDMGVLRSRQREAQSAAKILASHFGASDIVDTIVCMDGCGVVGAYLAEELGRNRVMTTNRHASMYVVVPEMDGSGQLIFRDNNQAVIRDNSVLLLFGTATTGQTIERALQSVAYYGGRISGITALFSLISRVGDIPIHSIFSQKDVPGYQSYGFNQCPLCKQGIKIDAIVNGYGYSKL